MEVQELNYYNGTQRMDWLRMAFLNIQMEPSRHYSARDRRDFISWHDIPGQNDWVTCDIFRTSREAEVCNWVGLVIGVHDAVVLEVRFIYKGRTQDKDAPGTRRKDVLKLCRLHFKPNYDSLHWYEIFHRPSRGVWSGSAYTAYVTSVSSITGSGKVRNSLIPIVLFSCGV